MAVAAPAAAPPVPVAAALPPARPPGYYVRQRLLRNTPAMLGLGFIVLCTLVAVLGYWVLPDNSPSANNGLVQLQKEAARFSGHHPAPAPARFGARSRQPAPDLVAGPRARASARCPLPATAS